MVFAVEGFVETVGPGVAVIPVEVAGYGEVGVEGGGVGDVADESIYPCCVGGEPIGIKVSYDGGCVDEISVAGP